MDSVIRILQAKKITGRTGKAEILGASVSEMVTIKYDYSDLPGWSELEEQIIILKEKQKEIEARKNIPQGRPTNKVSIKYIQNSTQ